MEQQKLQQIIDDHRLWLDNKKKQGKRAELRGANLKGANLTGADQGSASTLCKALY